MADPRDPPQQRRRQKTIRVVRPSRSSVIAAVAAIAITVFAVGVPFAGDGPKKVFELKDGTDIVGTVIDEGETHYLVRTGDGTNVRVSYESVLRVTTLGATASDATDKKSPGGEPTPRQPVVQPKQVQVRAGTFKMGCYEATTYFDYPCDAWEGPVHSVTLTRDFLMTKSEITQGQYEALVGSNPSRFKSCGADCPVENVTFAEAVRFADLLSADHGLEPCGSGENPYECEGWRLPTEAEWEFAARAGQSYYCSGSEDCNEVAWFHPDANKQTHPVCTKAANGFGLCDMSGNVWEWVWDRY